MLRATPAEAAERKYWYPITDYGATPAAATAGINAAIADAASAPSGGVVYIPNPTGTATAWTLSDTITMQSNVVLHGQDMRQTILRMPSNLNKIIIDHPTATTSTNGIKGAIVENLAIDGLWNASTLAPPALRYGGGAQHCIARNIAILNSGGHGVRVNTIGAGVGSPYKNMLLENIAVEACEGNGFDIEPLTQTGAIMMRGLSVRSFGNLTPPVASFGMRIAGRCLISQAQVGPLTSGDTGIAFVSGSGSSVLSNYWIDNTGSPGTATSVATGLTCVLGVGTVKT